MKVIVRGACTGAVALLAAVATISAQQGQGQTGAATKLAYINTREILRQTPGYAQAESTYNKEVDTYQSEVQKLRLSLDSAAGDFERQSRILSPTAAATKRKALEDLQQKAEQRFQDLQEKIRTRERELLEPIQSKINSKIEGIRVAEGYAIIFDISSPNSGIVTADRSLDLTQKVIQQLKSGS